MFFRKLEKVRKLLLKDSMLPIRKDEYELQFANRDSDEARIERQEPFKVKLDTIRPDPRRSGPIYDDDERHDYRFVTFINLATKAKFTIKISDRGDMRVDLKNQLVGVATLKSTKGFEFTRLVKLKKVTKRARTRL